tara:strand:+ start:4793 stop:6046 length:1254 start_codon:yes stop_codon:yes gene_type:complete
MKLKKIAVVGLGYIGLPTSIVLASNEQSVYGYDINEDHLKKILSGEYETKEPGLNEKLQSVLKNKQLEVGSQLPSADVFIICVPTPIDLNNENPVPDLSYVKKAFFEISKVIKKGDLIILESTSPVGTTRQMSEYLETLTTGLTFPHNNKNADVNISYCPERVIPGNIIFELIHNDRVIGGLTESCAQNSMEIYKLFIKSNCYLTNAQTAELVKLVENSYRDVNIAFANELSMLCPDFDIDHTELIKLSNLHPRVNILSPGAGVGGHCIAVDPWFIVSNNPKKTKLIKTARIVNDLKPKFIFEDIKKYITKISKKAEDDIAISCFGLAYKPNVDDLRESPALEIYELLKKNHKGKVLAIEPNISNAEIKNKFNIIEQNEGIEIADLAVILVAHEEFRNMQLGPSTIVLDYSGMGHGT